MSEPTGDTPIPWDKCLDKLIELLGPETVGTWQLASGRFKVVSLDPPTLDIDWVTVHKDGEA